MKIKKLLDNKILLNWYEFKQEVNIGGIIVMENDIKDIRGNEGTVRMIGPNVKNIQVGDYIYYAVGSVFIPVNTDHGKEIIIPETDVLFILENPEEK